MLSFFMLSHTSAAAAASKQVKLVLYLNSESVLNWWIDEIPNITHTNTQAITFNMQKSC